MRGALGRGDRLRSGRGAGDRMCKYRHLAVVAADRYKLLWPAGPYARGRAGDVAGQLRCDVRDPRGEGDGARRPGHRCPHDERVDWLYRDHFVPIFPLPYSSRPSVVARTTVSTDKATGTFTARHPGHATLFTTAYCLDSTSQRETHGKCSALDITVLP